MRRLASNARFLMHDRRNSALKAQGTEVPATSKGSSAIRKIVDRTWVWLGGDHVMDAAKIGEGDHDCALASLYWATPWIPEDQIIEAFGYCAENWPYGGITNKEFQIALKYLNTESCYCADPETLGSLLSRRPSRCVALLHGHFVAIIDGKIVGRDAKRAWDCSLKVYCHWTFHSRREQVAEGLRRIFLYKT